MATTTLRVEGMHCEGCADRIGRVLGREPGVRKARVSFERGEAEVRYHPQRVATLRLVEIVETAGFGASTPES